MSTNIRNIRDLRNIHQNIQNNEDNLAEADRIWNLFVQTNDEDLVFIVRSFFQQIEGMEPFFYYVMSKRVLVDHLPEFIQEFLASLSSGKILMHVIDGWEDFFLRSNYTIGDDTTREELESYRITVADSLHVIVGHLGESHNIPEHYRRILFDYFFIRI